MRRGTTAAVVAGMVGASLVIAGCTTAEAGPTSTPSPPQTPSEAPTPTPTPTPTESATSARDEPERPAAMSNIDDAGAEAAAHYFLALYGYVYATNDLQPWQAISHAECIFCASALVGAEQQIEAGEVSEGGSVRMKSVDLVHRVSERLWTVDGEMVQEPLTVRDADGGVVVSYDEDSGPISVMVMNEGDGWVLREVDFEPGER